MVLKMRFENPDIEYVKDLDPRECWECTSYNVCIYKNKLDKLFGELPTWHKMDMGVARAWLTSWAVFCPYFKPEEEVEE